MSRPKKLSPVSKLAGIRKLNAARTAMASQRRLLEYENRLAELVRFRHEYGSPAQLNTDGLKAGALKEYQKFISQLDEGIAVLRHQLEGQKQHYEIDRQAWLTAYQRSDALDRLVDKMQNIENRIRELKRANELDERFQHGKMKN